MKILIVDDQQAKIASLVQALTKKAGLDRNDIEIAQCAIEARKVLRTKIFDLLILDILLPLRPEDKPSIQTSVELLEELSISDEYHRPAHILGLTAFSDAAKEAGPHFAGRLWAVLRYDETVIDWAAPILKSIEYLKGIDACEPSKNYQTDLCIVTALPEEMAAVHRLPWTWQPWEPLDDTTFVRKAEFSTSNSNRSVVTGVAPRMGMVATALLSSKLISMFRPRFLVMGGICAGMKLKSNLGDVIFGDPTWDWQSGKRVRDKDNTQFAIAPHQLPAPEFIRSRIGMLGNELQVLEQIRAAWPSAPSTSLRIIEGPLASGSAVLADGQVVAEIKHQHRNLVGIDMEAYGLYAAAQQAGIPRPSTFALKAVCDFADPDKSDDLHSYAAYTSAAIISQFFQTYIDEIADYAGS